MKNFVVTLILIFQTAIGPYAIADHAGGDGGGGKGGPEYDPVFTALSSAELDKVNVVDVAKCWALVTTVVATAGRAAQVLRYLGQLGKWIHKADTKVEHTIGGWIQLAKIPGVEGPVAEGLGVLIVKAAELLGIYSVGKLSKEAMLKLVQGAVSLASSCSKVVQVYYDGIKSAGQLLFGSSPVCDGKIDRYVSCQKVCGASVSLTDKYRTLSSRLPKACDFEPIKESMITFLAGGMQQMCYQHYCAGKKTYFTDRNVERMSQCGPYYSRSEDREISQNMEDHCKQAKVAKDFLNKD